jgi:hypothetical protein
VWQYADSASKTPEFQHSLFINSILIFTSSVRHVSIYLIGICFVPSPSFSTGEPSLCAGRGAPLFLFFAWLYRYFRLPSASFRSVSALGLLSQKDRSTDSQWRRALHLLAPTSGHQYRPHGRNPGDYSVEFISTMRHSFKTQLHGS